MGGLESRPFAFWRTDAEAAIHNPSSVSASDGQVSLSRGM